MMGGMFIIAENQVAFELSERGGGELMIGCDGEELANPLTNH
jgi:hypothetical protein